VQPASRGHDGEINALVYYSPNTLSKSVELDEISHNLWERFSESPELIRATGGGMPNLLVSVSE
jgi:hypothetical protein